MSEQIGISKAERLVLEIDSRLSDLMLEAIDYDAMTLETLSSFIIRSYQQGVDDVIMLEKPESLYLDFGYVLPSIEDPYLPPWLHDVDNSPDDSEIISYLEEDWQISLSDVDSKEAVAQCMRSAYGHGHTYSYFVHMVKAA